jgi:hypothetical protein
MAVEDKITFLLEGLSNKAKVVKSGNKYQLFNCQLFDHLNQEYITGELVKYKDGFKEEFVNEQTNSLGLQDVNNKVIAKSRFILDIRSSLIMHFEITNQIFKKSFEEIFCKLFEMNSESVFPHLNISPIIEKYSFIERIKEVQKLEKIKIILQPSNPRFADQWKLIDKKLRDNHIKKYTEIQESKNQNESIIVDDETQNKFLMSEDGYGEAYASGTNQSGEPINISTKDKNKLVHQDLESSDLEAIEILNRVKKVLESIIQRTTSK